MPSESTQKLRIAVLVSGSGTNLQALIDRAGNGELAAEIVTVVSDRESAFGLSRARQAGIPVHFIDYNAYLKLTAKDLLSRDLPIDLGELDRAQKILHHHDREKRILQLGRLVLAEQDLIDKLDRYQPDLICLAGYMRLLTPYFLSRYNAGERMRVLNIHPALLPAFPGQHGYEDTLAYGCKWGGITVHFVDEGEDSGPILAQAVYPIWPGDDEQAVRSRGLQLEYEIYAQCINWLAAGQIKMVGTSSKRLSAINVDPLYPDVMKRWLQKAFM